MLNIEVKNHDIAGLVERADQVRVELLLSQSADLDSVREADRERADANLAMLVAYANWAAKQPQLDLPETHPTTFVIDYLSTRDEVEEKVENKAVRDLDRMLKALIIELSNSQSARAPSGIISHDMTRFEKLIEKIRSFLTDYVDVATPLDLPETMPSEKAILAGRQGV